MAKLHKIKDRLGRLIGGKKDPGNAPATVAQTATINAPQVTHNPRLQSSNSSGLNLVNYSQEELLQQIDHTLSRVQFGWSRTAKWMEGFSEFWSWMGPLVLLAGTIGEVFIVLWTRQKIQDIVAGMSIVAVALVLEGTFLAVSYKAARIRNRAERSPNGASRLDKKKMFRQFVFWFALAIGVCSTQIIFIIAQTKDDGIGTYGVWAFAGLRAFFTLVADGYTAFAHEEHPTTEQQALEEQEQRAMMTQKFLTQKKQEITIINDGVQEVREAHTEAEIKEDKMKTRLETEKLANKSQLDALRTQQEQATMFTSMSGNMMRALFDPTLPDSDREKLLNIMQGFMSATKYLPETTQYRIEEEDM
jgi:hypothetical protein